LKDVPFEKWDTRVVPFQGWNCIFGRPFDYKIPQLTILGVEAVIRKALEICDTNGWKEIAISALAGNYLGENDDQINDITRVALEYYFERNPESGLERIYLVNFEREIFRI
jgi:hypothetical protein